jgi:hypothetical protein
MLTRRKFFGAAGSVLAAGFIPEKSQVLRAMPQAETDLGKEPLCN